MLNYKNAKIIFIIVTGIVFALGAAKVVQQYWLLSPIALLLVMIIYGSLNIQSDFFISAYSSGNKSLKEVSLTFDDGPHNNTLKVLSQLAIHNVNATFFVIGKNIKGNENILKQIDQEGHLIGNHTFTHSYLIDFKSSQAFEKELIDTNRQVEKVIGKQPNLFRPPYGVTTPSMAKACHKLNLNTIGWNVRSLDTTLKNKEKLVRRIKSKIEPGAVILFHDTIDGIDIVLEEILKYLNENNYEVVPLPKLLNVKAYA